MTEEEKAKESKLKAEKAKKEKEAKKKEQELKSKEKKYYKVTVECLVPATLTFKVYAESAEKALEEFSKGSPNDFKPQVAKRKNIKASVYEYGYSNLLAAKNYR